MGQWKYYVSGICFGILEKEDSQVFHRPLDVFTGVFQERTVLTKEECRYRETGKMDPLEALLNLDAYEEGIRTGKDRFETKNGDVFTRRRDGEYVQRYVKFPRDLIAEDGHIIAFLTTYRDQCTVLVKEGSEDRTILRRWKEKYPEEVLLVKPPMTVMVEMRDGIRLATDVYLPSIACGYMEQKNGNAGAEVGQRVPSVLVRTPYGKCTGASAYYKFVQRGYAVILQDVRGREDSEGEWLPNFHEVEDGDDTLNWIASQEWSDGNVGMTGGSYLGYVQWAAAASGNPHLKAMLSSMCAGSAFIDLPRRGGCFTSGMMAWAFMVSGQRSSHALMERDDWDEILDIRPLEEIAPHALGHQIPFLSKWLSHRDQDEFWKMSSWKERNQGNRVPAVIMSGWFDDNGMGTTEALDLYEDYDEKKVILGPWIHSGNAHYDVHGLELGDNALRYDMDLICLDWLEHYLKGVENGIEKTPKVEYYTMGENQWKTAENWPVPGLKERSFYFGGNGNDAAVKNEGVLSEHVPDNGQADTYLYDPDHPSTHIIDMSENEIEVPEDYTEEEKRGDVLCYSTEPLREELTVTGDALAEIYLSCDCEDTDLVVRITDVDESGRSMKLADGLLCVRYRNGFDHAEFMEPGRIYRAQIRTTKLSHTFKKGHKLRVTVTSSAKNFVFPNRNTRDGYDSVEKKNANVTIHRGGDHASRVIVRTEK